MLAATGLTMNSVTTSMTSHNTAGKDRSGYNPKLDPDTNANHSPSPRPNPNSKQTSYRNTEGHFVKQHRHLLTINSATTLMTPHNTEGHYDSLHARKVFESVNTWAAQPAGTVLFPP
jgi:hypothetical protein